MDGNPIFFARSSTGVPGDAPRNLCERIIEFYEDASADYEQWSRGLNMHLGFYRRGMNPFDREAMLEQMNLEVATRLNLDPKIESSLIDLGCGMGSTARSVAVLYPNSTIKGVTLSPSQVRIASELNSRINLSRRIKILGGNYLSLPVDSHSTDGVWAVESACYAEGGGKDELIREVRRVLKPGGRFVVADCFIKSSENELNPLVRRCYRTVCDSWALSELASVDKFVATLEGHGFVNILVEDISWRVAPSLAHAPVAVSTFVLNRLRTGQRMNRHSVNNLKASLLAMLLGLNRSKFSYCLVSGTSAEA